MHPSAWARIPRPLLVVLLAACAAAPANALTSHGGTISADETWTGAGEVHLITSDVTVASGVTLTLEPGAIVKFQARYHLSVNGTLLSEGTALDPITFTSYKDDTVGGDTNGDADATTPAGGDWWRINFTNSPGSELSYTNIRYGGYQSHYTNRRGMVFLKYTTFVDPAPLLQNCEITDSYDYGVYCEGGSASEPTIDSCTFADVPTYAVYNSSTSVLPFVTQCSFDVPYGVYVRSSSAVTNNTFNDATGHAIYVYTTGATISGNTTSGSTNYAVLCDNGSGPLADLSGNTFAGTGPFPLRLHAEDLRRIDANGFTGWIGARGYECLGGSMTTTATWPDFSALPLVLTYTTATVESGATLTLRPGSIIKFNAQTHFSVNGTLLSEGDAQDHIVFTSYEDDTAGGDTNGDGAATSPAPGDWWRIIFFNFSGSSVIYTDVRYGGYQTHYSNRRGMIYLNYGSFVEPAPLLQSCAISDSYDYGVYCEGASSTEPTIDSCSFDDVPVYAVYNSSTTVLPTVSQCSFDVPYGVYVRSPSAVTDNSFNDATSHAIYVHTTGATITGNTTTGATSYAVLCDNGAGPMSDLSGNTFAGTGPFPVRLHAEDVRRIDDNSFAGWSGARGYECFGGSMTTSATWPDFSTLPLVMTYTTTTIDAAATLALTPGSIIKFNAQTHFDVNGTLLSEGTDADHIVFTSYKDDAAGGDTNGDGDATLPAPGNWWRINFTNSEGSRLVYADIRYGGYYNHYSNRRGMVFLNYSSFVEPAPVIQNCAITDSYDYGVYCEGGSSTEPTIDSCTFADVPAFAVYNTSTAILPGVSQCSFDVPYGVYVRSASSVTDNTFADATSYAIYINGSGAGVTGNTTTGSTGWGLYTESGSLGTLSGNSFSGTGTHPVRMHPNDLRWLTSNTFDWPLAWTYQIMSGTLTENATWRALEVPYEVVGSFTIDGGDTLTIDAATIVKMNRCSVTINGGFYCEGVAGAPVVFTSIKDDTWGGDSNGDGAGTTPVAGDWYHIRYTSSASGGQLDHVVLPYGGYGNGYTLRVESISPAINDLTIENGSTHGLYLSGGCASQIARSTFSGATYGVFSEQGSNPTFTDCNITGNSSWGIYNADSGTTVSAENCWWGSDTGPYHAGTNPSGTGDAVTDYVDFTPWRDIEYTANAIVVTLTPYQSIVPRGGTGDFKETLTNTSDTSESFTHRFRVLDAGGDPYHSFAPTSVTLAAGETQTTLYSMKVPVGTPLGIYTVEARAYEGPTVLDVDSFQVEVIDVAGAVPEGEPEGEPVLAAGGAGAAGRGGAAAGAARARTSAAAEAEGAGWIVEIVERTSSIRGAIAVAEGERLLEAEAGFEAAGEANEGDQSLDSPAADQGRPQLPAPRFGLGPAAPNPFNPSTLLRFAVEEAGPLSLRIYDSAGRLVRTLAEGERQAGYYSIRWKGDNEQGRGVPSGVYSAVLIAGKERALRRLVLVK